MLKNLGTWKRDEKRICSGAESNPGPRGESPRRSHRATDATMSNSSKSMYIYLVCLIRMLN